MFEYTFDLASKHDFLDSMSFSRLETRILLCTRSGAEFWFEKPLRHRLSVQTKGKPGEGPEGKEGPRDGGTGALGFSL